MRFAQEAKFSEILNENDTGSTRNNFEAQKASAMKSQTELRTKYDNIIANFEEEDIPKTLLNSLISRSVVIQEQLEIEVAKIADLDMKLAELSATNVDVEQTNFLAAYDEIKGSDDTAKLRELRFAMAGLLKRIIDKIVIHNDMSIYPWEADVISDKLHDQIMSLRNIKTQDDVENYLSKPTGKRAYTESERYFVIKFKSGVERVIHPYSGSTYHKVSEKMAEMKTRMKKS